MRADAFSAPEGVLEEPLFWDEDGDNFWGENLETPGGEHMTDESSLYEPEPVPEPGVAPEEAPPDPAALVVAWLRRGFDGLHVELQQITAAMAEQQADLTHLAGSQSALDQVAAAQALLSQAVETQASEINVSLAELEGCAAQLRNEAASLHNLRAELSVGFGAMLLELREALVAELPGIVAQAVEPIMEAAVVDISARIDELQRRAEQVPDPVLAIRQVGDDLNERLSGIVTDAVRVAFPGPVSTAYAPADAPPTPFLAPEPLAETGVPLRVASPVPPAEIDQVPEEPEEPEEPEARVEALVESVGQSRPGAPAISDPARSGAVEADRGGTDVTCAMAGVAVGPSLAVAVATALERSRIRRRRRRRAGPPGAGLHRRDPYVGAVGSRLERFALARGDRVFEPRSAEAPPELRVAAGEYGGHEFAIDLGVLGCLCVVGDQAAGVARALVASLLSQPGRGQAEIIAVGDLIPATSTVPGMTHVEDDRAALDRLDAEVAERAKRLADDGAPSVVVYNERHPEDPITPLLVATTRPADADGQRLQKVVAEGGPCGVAAVVVGAQLDRSPTLRLSGSGVVEWLHPETTLGGLIGARLFLLSPDSMAQVVAIVAAARTDDDDPTVADDEPFVVLDPPGEVPIQVQLLGPYRIDAAGSEIRSGLRAKARELLAFYLLHPEGTTLDTATEALWPEADPGRGSEWFWTALGNLRSLLRSTTGIKELKVIEREGDIYRVEPIFDVDLWRLQQVLDEASANGDRAGDGVGADELWAECLQRASELYSGELLEGADWAWARVPRDDLRRRALDVLVSLSASRLATSDIGGALDVLERAVEVDPYSEQVYRRIMRLNAKLARPDAVAATFRRLKARLADVDLEPTTKSETLSRELSAGT